MFEPDMQYEQEMNAMRHLDITKFSKKYYVRQLTEEDIPRIYALCQKNRQYYEYCGKLPTKELIRSDLTITPPGIDICKKYYIGFFEKDTLLAVMDLIDGYPDDKIAFIGFFMMNIDFQGNGLGSSIISKVLEYLKENEFMTVRLGIDKGNPQSNHFWKKNGFDIIKEVPQDEGIILLTERTL